MKNNNWQQFLKQTVKEDSSEVDVYIVCGFVAGVVFGCVMMVLLTIMEVG